MKSKIISFWSPVSRSGCSTNAALYISYLSKVMNEMDKAVLFSINTEVDSVDYLTDSIIKEGLKKLKILHENCEIHSKEDIYVYTHKISENIDVLGTDKIPIAFTEDNIKLMIEILSKAYDYIVLDITSAYTYQTILDLNILDCSSVVVSCIPQDKYICENYSKSEMISVESKNLILISDYDDKKAVKKADIEVILQRSAYTINHDIKINKACDERDIYSYVNGNKLSNVEFDKLYREIERLINNENLSVKYDLKSNIRQTNKRKVNEIVEKSVEEITKVVKEYKFIKAKNNIAIINLSQGAGSTFLTLNLACFLKEKKLNVNIIELPNTYLKKHDTYSILNCDEEIPCVVDGIKYFINTDKDCIYTEEQKIDYINIINRESNSINLYDLGNADLSDNTENYLLNLLDCCIIVIEALPYKLLQTNLRFDVLTQELKNKGVEIIYVINKFIDDLSKNTIENYLDCKVTSYVQFLKPETIYAAHYASKPAYKIEKNEMLKDSLQKIADRANIAVNLEEKRKRIFDFLFKTRKD